MNAVRSPLGVPELEAGTQTAENLARVGRYAAAREALVDLIGQRMRSLLRSHGDFCTADLVVMQRASEIAAMLGRLDVADPLMHAYEELCRRHSNDVAADYAVLVRAEFAMNRGSVDEAEQRLASLSLMNAVDASDFGAGDAEDWELAFGWPTLPSEDRALLLSRYYMVAARVAMSRGHYAGPKRCLARAAEHARSASAPPLARAALPALALLLARAELESGRFDEARACLIDLLESTSPLVKLQATELSGRIDLLTGRLGSGIALSRSAMDGCERLGLHRGQAVAALNMANALILLNDVGQALAIASRAARIAEQIGDEALRARALTARRVALARRSASIEGAALSVSIGRVDEPSLQYGWIGDEPVATCLSGSVSSESTLARFEEAALAFHWRLARDPSAAAGDLTAIERAYGTNESVMIRERIGVLEGFLRVAERRDEAALACFARACTQLEELALLPECWQLLSQRAKIARRLGHHTEAKELSERATTLLNGLVDSLDGKDQPLFLLNKATADEEYLIGQADRVVEEHRRAAGSRFLRAWAGRLRLLRRVADLFDHLDTYRSRIADQGIGVPSRRVDWRDGSLGQRLFGARRDTVTLVFVVLPDRLMVLWSTFLRMGVVVSPVTRVALREAAKRWHTHVQAGYQAMREGRDVPEPEPSVLQDLARMLQLDTVLRALPNAVSRLSIVADDVLNGLPFAALPYAGGCLVETYSLNFDFQSRPIHEKRSRAARGCALVVGMPLTASEAPLPNVVAECDHVRAWMHANRLEPRVLLQEQATAQAVSERLSHAAVAHLACHGVFDAQQPEQSGLLMYSEFGTERLTIRDLARTVLRQCGHVTLSACWSADSFVLPGRWVISLPQVLRRSGADSVLGSLWQVVDQTSTEFMQRFYGALTRLPGDKALREAQLAFLHDARPARRLPFFWAGFVYYGARGRLRFG